MSQNFQRRKGVYTNRGYSSRRNNSGRRSSGQAINPSQFIKAAKVNDEQTVQYEPKHTFADFDMHPLLHANIAEKGYEIPSPIQDQAIPAALNGHNVVGLANTGTGKTAAFALPLLHRLMLDKSSRALIVAPTRELAQQIDAECRSFAKGSGLFSAELIGGTPMFPQVKDLRNNPQLVIGTPGRIKDHVERKNLNLSQFNIVVLDEVDRMLDMGFIDDITMLLSQLNDARQSLFFSATMERKIEKLIESFATNPVTISVVSGRTSDHVDQNIVRFASMSSKIDKLHDILIGEKVAKVLIFDETKRSVDRLSQELVSRGFAADSIHGDKSQGQRKRALDKFRNNHITVLVATDVAARGIDVTDITHVINYSAPQTYDDYIHRIGRAGRAGRAGFALTFVR